MYPELQPALCKRIWSPHLLRAQQRGPTERGTGTQGLGPVQGHFGAAPPLVSLFRQHAQPQDVFSTVVRLAGGPIALGGASAPGGSLVIGGIDPAITALNQDLTWCAAALADAVMPQGSSPLGVCLAFSGLTHVARHCSSRCSPQLALFLD